jgi:hypothetical protein
MTGSSRIPEAAEKPVAFMIPDAMKKGRSDGTTTLAQISSPFSAALTAVSEKRIKHAIKIIHNTGSDSILIYITREGRIRNRTSIIMEAKI